MSDLSKYLINSDDITLLIQQSELTSLPDDDDRKDKGRLALCKSIHTKVFGYGNSITKNHKINCENYDNIYITSDIHGDYRKFLQTMLENRLVKIQNEDINTTIDDIYKDDNQMYHAKYIQNIEWIGGERTLLVIDGNLIGGNYQKYNYDPKGIFEVLIHIFIHNLRIKALAKNSNIIFTFGMDEFGGLISIDLDGSTVPSYLRTPTETQIFYQNRAGLRVVYLLPFYYNSPYLFLDFQYENKTKFICVSGGIHQDTTDSLSHISNQEYKKVEFAPGTFTMNQSGFRNTSKFLKNIRPSNNIDRLTEIQNLFNTVKFDDVSKISNADVKSLDDIIYKFQESYDNIMPTYQWEGGIFKDLHRYYKNNAFLKNETFASMAYLNEDGNLLCNIVKDDDPLIIVGSIGSRFINETKKIYTSSEYTKCYNKTTQNNIDNKKGCVVAICPFNDDPKVIIVNTNTNSGYFASYPDTNTNRVEYLKKLSIQNRKNKGEILKISKDNQIHPKYYYNKFERVIPNEQSIPIIPQIKNNIAKQGGYRPLKNSIRTAYEFSSKLPVTDFYKKKSKKNKRKYKSRKNRSRCIRK
jgi:hypothetical protein